MLNSAPSAHMPAEREACSMSLISPLPGSASSMASFALSIRLCFLHNSSGKIAEPSASSGKRFAVCGCAAPRRSASRRLSEWCWRRNRPAHELLEADFLAAAASHLKTSRPTAVNLFWAIERMEYRLAHLPQIWKWPRSAPNCSAKPGQSLMKISANATPSAQSMRAAHH